MASFKEQYEELFGPVDPYDPIDVGQFGQAVPRRSALPTGPEDMAGPAVADPYLGKPPSAPDDSGFFENLARQFGAGAVQVGEMGVGALEYGARQNSLIDLAVADSLYSGRQKLAGVREGITSQMSQEDLQQVGAELLTLDPDRTIWKGNPLDVAEAVAYKFANALPATLVTMIPAVSWFRALSPGKAIASMGATEGTMSLGGIANGITDEIMSIPDEQLLQDSPRFAQLVEANGGDTNAARQELIQEAQGVAPLVGGATVAAISAVAGRYFQPIFEKPGQALGARAARGFAAEAPQEGSQGATEQLVQNYSARIYDADRQLSEGVAEAGAQEALIGGGMGAGAGALFGERPAPPPVVEDDGQIALPGFGPQQLTPDEEVADPLADPTLDQWHPGMGVQQDLFTGDPEAGTDFVMVPPVEEDAASGQLILPGFPPQASDPEVDEYDPNTDPRNDQWHPGQGVQQDLGFKAAAKDLIAQFDEGEQGVLPLGTGRRRGVGQTTLTELPRGYDVPAHQPALPGDEVAVEEGIDIAPTSAGEVSRRTGSLLEPEAQTGSPGQRETLGTAVRMFDEEGGVVDEQLFETQEEADEYADQLADDFPDARITVQPFRSRTGVERPTARDDRKPQPADQPSVEEEVGERLRKNVPFEERAEAAAAAKGARSVRQAGAAVLAKGAKAFEAEEKQRIGGFYAPDMMEFNNPDYESDYRDAWGKLLDAELTIETSNNTRAKERAGKVRKAQLQELGKIRQVDKSKRKQSAGQPYVRAAKAIAPEDVSTFEARMRTKAARDDSEQDYLGEFEAKSREDIDNLASYRVRHKTPSAKNWTTEEFDDSRAAYARQDEIKEKYPKRSVTVDVVGTRALDEEFERAVTFREGREARVATKKSKSKSRDLVDEGEVKAKTWREKLKDKTAPKRLSGKLKFSEEVDEEGVPVEPADAELEVRDIPGEPTDFRAENRTPGDKLKFIRRESEARRRIDTGQKGVKAIPVAVTGKKVDATALTSEDKKPDESVANRLIREQSAKTERANLKKATTKARAYLRKTKTKSFTAILRDHRDPTTGQLDKEGVDYMYAKQYLSELIQFADSLVESQNNTADAIKLSKILSKEFQALEGMAFDKFASKWSGLAKKTEAMALMELRNTSLGGLATSKSKRKRDALKSNSARLSHVRQRSLWEGVLANDNTFQSAIAPTLRKMAQSAYDVIEGISGSVYTPTEAEVAAIKFALRDYRLNKTLAKSKDALKLMNEQGAGLQKTFDFTPNKPMSVYKPLRKHLEYYGFQFDDKGDVTGFEATSEYHGPAYNRKFKGETEGGEAARVVRVAQQAKRAEENLEKMEAGELAPPSVDLAKAEEAAMLRKGQALFSGRSTVAEDSVEEAAARLARNKKALAAGKPIEQPPRVAGQALGLTDAVNGLIDQFKNTTKSSKTTISGLVRQEQRFIRKLRQLGVWTDSAPGMGQIKVGEKSRTYRLVTPRLEARAMTRPDARAAIQKLGNFAVPRPQLAATQAARQDEGYQTILNRFLSDEEVDLFAEAANPVEYDADYMEAATLIGDSLVSGSMDANAAVRAVLQSAPQDSFYYRLADKLQYYNLGEMEIGFGHKSDFASNELGKFRRRDAIILLNREGLRMHRMTGDNVLGARVVHTVMHEMLHGITHQAIDNNPSLASWFHQLQTQARLAWTGDTLPYGLKRLVDKPQNEVHEFVVEAFSNPEFQTFLKNTPYRDDVISQFKSMWEAFVAAVRDIIGLDPNNKPNNLFDAILLTEDILFDDTGIAGNMYSEDLYLTDDVALNSINQQVRGLVDQAGTFWERARDRMAGSSRYLMTMEQLRDTYSKFFQVEANVNPLKSYMDAWARRNSRVSQLMKVPEKLSTRWTSLEKSDPAGALEVSRIGTEATMHRLSPSLTLNAAQREKLSEQQLAKYDELHARYNALSDQAKNLYTDARNYYKQSAEDESKLLLRAALRGILTKGKAPHLTDAQYKSTFTDDVIEGMVDEQSITAALSDVIPEEELDHLVGELTRMASLRQQGVGDYFPLMRYGDYAVFAEKTSRTEMFAERGDAMAERRKLLHEDPTRDVFVVPKDGSYELRVIEREFVMAESKSEAVASRLRLLQDYESVSDVQARQSKDGQEAAIGSNAALNSVLTSLEGNPAAQTAIKNHYLRSLSDQSFRKHELKRKNRRGVDYDLQHRNIANYSKQSAYFRSQLEFGWQMGEAIQDMWSFTRARRQEQVPPNQRSMNTEQLQRIVQQVEYRDKMTHDMQELNSAVRKGVEITQFMMLTSPSYWMINASQPWLVTAPIMSGKFGWGNVLSAMKQAQGLVKTPLTSEGLRSWGGLKAFNDREAAEKAFNVIDQLFEHMKQRDGGQELIDLIDHLRDLNIIDINVLTEMREIAQGVEGGTWSRVLDSSRILAHITEVNNRVVTSIAAYKLEKQAQLDKGAGEEAAIEAATNYAADMVSQTQFNYSTQNKPPLFQSGGPLKWAGPLMFQFMQWPQHMYALLIRNVHAAVKNESPAVRKQALKSLIGLLGTHAAVGGMVGMALQPIKWAFGMLMFAFGDDDEPYTLANAINGRTFDNLITETMTEMFGSELGAAFSRGVPAALGADLSSRMSMGTLYFVDLRGDTAESVLGSVVASFGGATLNQTMNWGRALGEIADGDILRGVERASPKIARDALRAVRYYNDGLVNTAGDTVINAKDLSFYDIFLQTAGFQPDKVSTFYQGQAAIKGAQGYARDRRAGLLKEFVTGDNRAEVLREVQEFNRAYPSMRITRSTLLRGRQSKRQRERRYDRYGANIDEQETRDFERYGDPYRD